MFLKWSTSNYQFEKRRKILNACVTNLLLSSGTWLSSQASCVACFTELQWEHRVMLHIPALTPLSCNLQQPYFTLPIHFFSSCLSLVRGWVYDSSDCHCLGSEPKRHTLLDGFLAFQEPKCKSSRVFVGLSVFQTRECFACGALLFRKWKLA